MKLAVVTVAIGDSWDRILESSRPTLEAYARKIGAEFIPVRDRKFNTQFAAYEKLRVRDLFSHGYDRAVVVDADVLIRGDAPNLFEVVPAGSFGALPYTEKVEKVCSKCGHPVDQKESWVSRIYVQHSARLGVAVPDHQGQYFDTGVFVCDQAHREVFIDPPKFAFVFYEQTWLNIRAVELKVPYFPLPWEFNCWDSQKRHGAYMAHYKRSCCHYEVEEFCGILEGRKAIWRKAGLL